MDWSQSYHALEALIKTRQQHEKENPIEPFTTYPTDINFINIHGNSLLQLACAMGDFAKVKECIDKGADLDYVTPGYDNVAIVIALRRGHLKIAKFLYGLGASFINVSPYQCGNDESEAWVTEIIQKGLHTTFPDPVHNIRCKVSDQIFDHTKTYSPLQRATEIGDIEFLQKAMNGIEARSFDFSLQGFEKEESLVVIAAKNNQLETLKFLLKHGAKVDSPLSATKSALMTAIEGDYETIIDYLLAHVKNINQQCNRKYNALIYAIYAENKSLIEKLIAKGADISNTDINDGTIVHAAVNTQNLEIVEQILALDGIEKLVDKENMYGFSPLDVVIQRKQESVDIGQQNKLSELSKLLANKLQIDSASLAKLENKKYKVLATAGSSLPRLRYYHSLKYRDCEFINGGQCAGFSFYQAWLASQGGKKYYLETNDLISKWDGNEATGDYIESLLEPWINNIIWFQHFKFSIFKIVDRDKQFNFVKEKHLPDYVSIHNDLELTYKTFHQISEIFFYLNRMPINTQFEIRGYNHIASAFINKDAQFDYDDSNFDHPAKQTSDINEQVRRFVDYMYTIHNKSPSSMDFGFHMFYFGSKEFCEKYQNFEIFKEDEYPNSKQEALEFQNQSPNHYSHLHLAVITHSLASLQKLLTADYCDMNAKDKQKRTALSIALKNNFKEAVDLFLSIGKINEDELLNNYSINPQFVREFLYQLDLSASSDWWYEALHHGELDLVKHLIQQYKINVNFPAGLELPLNIVLKTDTTELVQLLLDCGASITKIDGFKNSPLKVALMEKRHTDLILNRLIDVNQKDDAGFSAIDYAASIVNYSLIQELIKRGADVQGSAGLKILRIIESSLSSDDVKRKCKELIFPYYSTQSLLKCYAQLYSKEFGLLVNQCDKELLNQKLDNGFTLLDHTVRFGHRENIKALLEAGYDINAVELMGNTALMKYILSSKIKYPIISILLDYHAATDIKNDDGKTAIDLVNESNDKKLQQIFIDHGYTEIKICNNKLFESLSNNTI